MRDVCVVVWCMLCVWCIIGVCLLSSFVMSVVFMCCEWSVFDVCVLHMWLVLVYVWYALCGDGVCAKYISMCFIGCVGFVCVV